MTNISKINYISQATFGTKTQVDNELDFVNIGGSISMPSDTYDDLTLGSSGSTYTAPADGYFVLVKRGSSSGQYANIENSTNGLATASITQSSGNWVYAWLPVKKGDVVSIGYDAAGATETFRFIYAVGSEYEYYENN